MKGSKAKRVLIAAVTGLFLCMAAVRIWGFPDISLAAQVETGAGLEEESTGVSGGGTDPVLEQYILEHMNPDYVGDGETLALVNALLVKQTYFNADAVEDGDSIDSIMGLIENGGDDQEEALDKYIMQTGDYTAVYEVSGENGYYIAYADTMQDNPDSETREAVFAMNDTGAQILEGCIYDSKSGLVYIPKEYFFDEDGSVWLFPVQVQFMQILDTDCNTTEVTAVVGNGEEITSTISSDVSFYDTDTTMQTEAGMDADHISVYVNGTPVSEDSFAYESESGELTIHAFPSGVENVYVETSEETVAGSLIDKMRNLLGNAGVYTEAFAVSYSSMDYFATNIDVSNISVDQVWTGTAGVIYSDSTSANGTYGAYLDDSDIANLQAAIYSGGSAGVDLETVYSLSDSRYCTTRVYLGKGETATINGSVYSPISTLFTPFAGISKAIAMECCHVNAFGISSAGAEQGRLYTNKLVRVRCLYKGVDSDGYEYAVFGIVTQTINTQSGTAIFKVRGDTEPENPVISTAYYKARQAYLPSLDIYIKKEDCDTGEVLKGAEFKVYMDGTEMGTVTTDGNGRAVYHWTGTVLYTSYSTYSQRFCANYNRISAEDKTKYSSVESSRSSAYTYAKSQVNISLSEKLENLKKTTHTWTIKETGSPENYYLNTELFEQKIAVSTTAIEVTFSDEPYGYANLEKESGNKGITDGNDCYSLEGAVYGVYAALADAEADTNRAATLTTDEEGKTNTVDLRAGTYYVKEVTASCGYSLDPQIYETSVEKGKTTTINSEDPPDYDSTGLILTKLQENTDFNAGHNKLYLSYLNEYFPDMSGAQFTVKYYDAQYSDLSEVESSHLQRTWVIQTKAVCGTCDRLFDDRDTCVSHMQSEHGITVKYDITYTAELTDAYLASGSDSLYYDSSGASVLPLGTITVEESGAAWGYLISGAYVTAEDGSLISDNGGVVLMNISTDHDAGEAVTGGGQLTVDNVAGNEIEKAEQLRRCSITIHKKDDRGNDCEGVEYSIAVLNQDTGEYEYIASYNGTSSLPNTEGLSYVNEDGVTVTATDAGGTVIFGNLVFGTYAVTETKTVDGLSLLAESFTVELPYAAESVNGSSTDYDFYDEKTGLYYWVDLTYEISDGVTFDVPQAGGERRMTVPVIAGLCIVFLGVLYAKRRKNSAIN
ncbi:MAG: prealbumin-like fold domain-containing protein [Lachnospiraceae bacterium]|nr:prealbumin-like fold domain-containing protein [Lachnospiraceae bacterium]